MNYLKIQFSLLLLLSTLALFGQFSSPDEVFNEYKESSINTFALFNKVRNTSNEKVYLSIGEWDLELEIADIISPDYMLIYPDGSEIVTNEERAIPLRGTTTKGGVVALTLANGFANGFIKIGSELHYIEPARYYDNSRNDDEVIIYNVKEIKPGKERNCGYHEVNKKKEELVQGNNSVRLGMCYEVDYAIVNDCSMFTEFGSNALLEAHVIGITNNINTDYDDSFEDEYKFVITGICNINCDVGDPWTSSTDSELLLADFEEWALFRLPFVHDVASLWTNRDFDGSTVGLANLRMLCKSDKYNVLQNFNSNAASLRVLASHELAHNFGAEHDSGANFIMSPMINITDVWSENSVFFVEFYGTRATCLTSCQSGVSELNFLTVSSSCQENGSSLIENDCFVPYKEQKIILSLNTNPTSTVNVSVSVSNSSTADLGYDFDFINSSVSFTNGGPLTRSITMRIYDDTIEEGEETIVLDINSVSGPAITGANMQHILTIKSFNDNIDLACCNLGNEITLGGPTIVLSGIFGGDQEDMKTGVLLVADDLAAMGLKAGNLDRLSFDVHSKESNGLFNDFTIGLTTYLGSELNDDPFPGGTTEVYHGDISTVVGWNDFEFDTEYFWDGISNIYVQICFNNSSMIGSDKVRGYNNQHAEVVRFVNVGESVGGDGCAIDLFNSYAFYFSFVPQIKLRQSSGTGIESTSQADDYGKIRVGETAHLISDDQEIVASIKNVGSTNLECVLATIETSGIGKASLPFGNFQYANKTMSIVADNSAIYELTLYYKDTELATWGSEKLKLNFIKSSSSIANSTEVNSSILFSKTIQDNSASGSNVAYTAVVNGPGTFALTNAYESDIKGDVGAGDIYIDELGDGILMKSASGDQYLMTVNASGSITTSLDMSASGKSKFMEGDFYLNTANRGLIFKRSSSTYTLVNVDGSGAINTTNTTSLPSQYINVEGGNFSFDEVSAGIIFKSSNGNCYKLYIDEAGDACTSEVPCN